MITNYQDYKVAMLPTEKETSILLCIKSYTDTEDGKVVDSGVSGYLYFGVGLACDREYFQPQHLYILSDEKIKDGDWVLLSYPSGTEIKRAVKGKEFNNALFWNAELVIDGCNHKRILFSTDLSLGLSDVPRTIIQGFIKEYSGNNPVFMPPPILKLTWTYDELLGNGPESLDTFLMSSVDYTQEDRETVMEALYDFINK